MVTVCPSQFATRRTLFHVLVGCGLLMLKVSRLKLPVIWLLRSEERFSRNAETDLVCRLLLEKKKKDITMGQIDKVSTTVSVNPARCVEHRRGTSMLQW